MKDTTISASLSLPNQALLFDLDELYTRLQTVTDRRRRQGLRYPLASLLMKGKPEAYKAMNEGGEVTIHHLYEYLLRNMSQQQSPRLVGEFSSQCSYVLARHPHLSVLRLDKDREAREDGLKIAINELNKKIDKYVPIDPIGLDHHICTTATFEDLDRDKIIDFLNKELVLQEEIFLVGLSVNMKII